MSAYTFTAQTVESDTAAIRTQIDATLDAFFDRSITAAQAIDPHYEQLWKSIHALSQAGGKRMRPQIALLTYRALSDQPYERILPVASSLELLHLSMLIHDDIIDRDYIRYGIDNVSGQYNTFYKEFVDDDAERRHFSDSAALLAGDLLIAGGHELIASADLTVEELRLASSIYTRAIFTVAGGELLDTESAFRPLDSIRSETISHYKTADYSFITPLMLGAKLAGASDEIITALTQYGEHVGIGFQMVDDLLGVFGDETVTGKSSSNDIAEAKHTYIIEQFYAAANDDQRKQFDALFGKRGITRDEVLVVRQLLEATGARDRAEQLAREYQQKALDTLSIDAFDDNMRALFTSIAERAINRQK